MSQVLTYDTVVGRELGLQDRMTALRNLRPGTRLSWPEGDLSREVLRELLSLPESIDVLRWLEAERGAAVALLAIEQSLDMAGMMYGAQNQHTRTSMAPCMAHCFDRMKIGALPSRGAISSMARQSIAILWML